MKAGSKCMQALAAIGQATTYADIHAVTGISVDQLTSSISVLKRRGYVARVNDFAPKCDIAIFRITSAGLEALDPEDLLSEPGETTVDRAIRKRPVLATIWPPMPACDGVDECFFNAAGQLAREAAEGRAG